MGAEPHQPLGQFRAPRSDKAGHAQNLAPPQAEGDPLHQRRHGEIAQLKRDAAELRPARREDVGQVAADHRGGHPVLGQLPPFRPSHDRAVAQDGNPVGDMADLIQPVRGVKQRHPRSPKPVDLAEEDLHLAVGQHGGGFVHDQHAGVARQRLRDLHHLPVGYRQISDARVGSDMAFQLVEQVLRASAHRLVVQEQPADLPPEIDVLGHRQILGEVEFLMDDDDAKRLGLGTRTIWRGFTVKKDTARCRFKEPAEDLHDRRLACAVLADQGVDLTARKRKIHAMQHLDRAKALVDIAKGEDLGHRVTQPALRLAEVTQAATNRMPARPSDRVG